MEISNKYEREQSVISMRDLYLNERPMTIPDGKQFFDASNSFKETFQNVPPTYDTLNENKNSRKSSIATTTNSVSPLVGIKTKVKPNIKKIAKRALFALNICTIIGLSVALAIVASRKNSDDGNQNKKQTRGATTEKPSNQPMSSTEQTTDSDFKTTTQLTLSQGSSQTINFDKSTSASPISQGSLSTSMTTQNGVSETSNTQDSLSTIKPTSDSESTSTNAYSQTTISSTTPSSSFAIWLPWGTWTDCSVTCGVGINFRYRDCGKSAHENGRCIGNYVQIDSCNKTACPEYGVWTQWSSWNSCNVTCNGGTQFRIRSCNKTDDSVLNCTGNSIQHQQCSDWNCPDCATICEEGTLTEKCDMCLCNRTRQGYVRTTLNETVSDAAVYIKGSHSTAIAHSKGFGTFSSDSICDDANIYVEKSGYSTSVCQIRSDKIFCNINKNEKPIMVEHPQPKARLEGENITLCCSAKSTPDIKYYEWVKESVLLDEYIYHSGQLLSLHDLSESHSGKYRCRAISDAGNIMSEEAKIIVKDTVNKFCENSLGQRQIHLPDDCVQTISMTSAVEVGYCNRQLCRKKDALEHSTCREESQSCCAVSDFDLNTIFCSGYNLTVLGVKACDCGECNFEEVRIIGTVLYYGTNEFVKFGLVYLNGIFKTYTNIYGSFKISVDERYGSAAITVINNIYQTTSVVDVSEGTTGTIYVSMYLAKESCILQISAAEDSIIDIGNCKGESVVSESLLVNVSAHSFIDSSLNTFDGIVNIYITFLNATNISEMDIMPGMFISVNEDGEKYQITSMGTFRIAFLDSLTSTALKLGKKLNLFTLQTYQSPLSAFWLQISDGFWYPISDQLQTADLTEPDLKSWISVGNKIINEKDCFFNIRIYKSLNLLSEITNSKYQVFIQTIHLDGLHSYETYGHTFSTSRTCFKTSCDGINGFIEVWISNSETETAEYLLPADPSESSFVGLSFEQRQFINYSVSTFDFHLHLKFLVSSNGPFFEDVNSCLAKTQDGNHFKFHFQTNVQDVFTLRHFNDLSSHNISAIKYVGQRVWYPKRQDGHRACFVKIKFVLMTNKDIKIRVTSYGGTNTDITNEILGIRETQTSSSETVCLEYKCSGTINEEFDDDDFDNTKVEIQYFNSTSTTCVVESYSQSLVSAFHELNPQNEGKNLFVFHAPTTSSPSLGLYAASTSGNDIETARSTAKKECRSGIPMDLSSNNPDIGIAVTFECD